MGQLTQKEIERLFAQKALAIKQGNVTAASIAKLAMRAQYGLTAEQTEPIYTVCQIADIYGEKNLIDKIILHDIFNDDALNVSNYQHALNISDYHRALLKRLKVENVTVTSKKVNTHSTDITTKIAAKPNIIAFGSALDAINAARQELALHAAEFPIDALTTDSFANKLVYCDLDTREMHIYSAGAYAICNMRGITLWDN